MTSKGLPQLLWLLSWVASVCRSQAAEGRSRCGVWNLAGLPSNSSVDKTLCSICIRKAWSYSQPLAPSASVARQQRTDQGRGQLIEGSWPGDRWNNLYTTSCRDVLSCWYWYCIRSSSSSSNINISNFSVLGGTIILNLPDWFADNMHMTTYTCHMIQTWCISSNIHMVSDVLMLYIYIYMSFLPDSAAHFRTRSPRTGTGTPVGSPPCLTRNRLFLNKSRALRSLGRRRSSSMVLARPTWEAPLVGSWVWKVTNL